MTDPIQPATDEEVESIRREVKAGLYGPLSEHPALIARIDAERAARERAERAAQQFNNAKAAIFTSVQGGARLYDAAAALQVERDEATARAERAEALLREILDNDLPSVSAVYDPLEHRVTEAWKCECGASAPEVSNDFDDESIGHVAGCLRGRARAALSRKDGG